MRAVEVVAPAKLTLSLRVLRARPDGYHELEALAVTVSEPADRITVAASDSLTLRVAGAADGVPGDAANLALRAARALDIEEVAIALDKEIPPGSGLGGGSSDAAAVLRVLRDHFGADAASVEIAAVELGSDVPMCLRGGAAWMRGRGDLVEPVAILDSVYVLTAVPPFACSTPAVYRAWDALGGPRSSREVPAPAAIAHVLDTLANDLEVAAEHVEPRLAAVRAEVEAVVGGPALLAGSGSAYAVVRDERAGLAEARDELRSRGYRCWVGLAPAM